MHLDERIDWEDDPTIGRCENYEGTIDDCDFGCGQTPGYFLEIEGRLVLACFECLTDRDINPTVELARPTGVHGHALTGP